MDECRALRAWAEALPIEPAERASDNFILNRLGFMQSTLPARAVDEDAGEKRTAVYVSILGGWSKPALTYMADRACRECRWFPTPRECLDLLEQYRPPITEREVTLLACDRFAHGQIDRWMDNVRDGQPLGDVPEQWLRIAVEQGHVRRLANGAYVLRALYHGPSLPVPVTWR